MAVEYFDFGWRYSEINEEVFQREKAKRTLSACLKSRDFEVIELRYLKHEERLADVIIVDCICDQVPTLNPFGIKNRERLAIVFWPNEAPQVRALRKDFPNIIHTNQTSIGDPIWLCLYFEQWSVAERTWTPQNFLQRIIWWLTESSRGTLHRQDQGVERIYFQPQGIVILPPDFDDKRTQKDLALYHYSHKENPGAPYFINTRFFPRNGMYEPASIKLLIVETLPIIQGVIEQSPNTLGELHDQMARREAPFIHLLNSEICRNIPSQGIPLQGTDKCILMLVIPIKRDAASLPETYQRNGYHIIENLARLGKMTGALVEVDNVCSAFSVIGNGDKTEAVKWRDIPLTHVGIKGDITKDFACAASGVASQTADFQGVLAGVGALGSAMADLWSKCGWGRWTLIDQDFVDVHNSVRHVATNENIGDMKVNVVKDKVEKNYHPGYYSADAIADSVNNLHNERVLSAIITADLIVDVTTTLEVPRDLSIRDDVKRSASAFLTPTGICAILLLESSDRSIRLDSLEAQYYRSIINSDWGEKHLRDDQGKVIVGTGCRDISFIMSNEYIVLHAATLARQIRLLRDQSHEAIKLWQLNSETGGLVQISVAAHGRIVTASNGWQVIWDEGTREKMQAMRLAAIPSETGGVVVGYVDQKLRSIYIVDILPAPVDSEANPTEFIRGVEGLKNRIQEISHQTLGLVNYIGEWHSHPEFATAKPSPTDRTLIRELADILAMDGQPALMVIIGTTAEVDITVKEG